MKYSLITGATGVLGCAFCRQLASRGNNLFLTGRSEQNLIALKNKLNEDYPSVDVKYYACDLSSDFSRRAFFAYACYFKFDRLVNVAGADIQKPFEEYNETKILFQIRACFEGAVSFSQFALKHSEGGLQIINISSVCGLQPMPYFAVYSASKAALTNFSVALNEEGKDKGVTSTAIIAGSIYTRPDVCEYIKNRGGWSKMTAKYPDFVAEKSLIAAEKGKAKYTVGFGNKFMRVFTKLIPERVKVWYVKRRWKDLRKDAF